MSKLKVGEKVKVNHMHGHIPAGAIGTVAEVNSGFGHNCVLVKFNQNFEGLHDGNGASQRQYDENKYYFFSPVDLSQLENETIVIYRKDDKIIALNKRTGRKNEIRDVYDFTIGAKIAFERLMQDKVQLSDLKPGKVFIAGEKKFAVLEQFGNTTAVTEVGELKKQKFDNNSNDWRSSDLRNYLNTDVLRIYENLFGSENIIETETDLTSLDGLNDYGKCDDKIRLMAFDEYRKYQFLFEREEKWEWLVTPWSTTKRGWDVSVCVVSPWGDIFNGVCYDDYAVRPFCILKSNIFVSLEDE